MISQFLKHLQDANTVLTGKIHVFFSEIEQRPFAFLLPVKVGHFQDWFLSGLSESVHMLCFTFF